jgi:hypothetical protein
MPVIVDIPLPGGVGHPTARRRTFMSPPFIAIACHSGYDHAESGDNLHTLQYFAAPAAGRDRGGLVQLHRLRE